MNANSEHIFTGDSEMAALMQAYFASADNAVDGSSESNGAIESLSFRTALNILLNGCSPMFLVWGSDRLLFYNDAYALLLRATDQPILVGQPVSNSWNQNWQQIRSDVEQVFATGQSRRYENQLLLGDRRDKQRYYTWSYSPLWDQAGEIEGVFATGCRVLVEDGSPAPGKPTPQDLEEALYRREEQLRLVTNAVPALIAYVDKDHCYQFNNRAYETWFGQRPSDLTHKHIREVLGETAYAKVLPYMEQALSGKRVSFESQIPYQTGGTRYVSADYVPHINSQGIVEGYFSLVSDITDRKQIEMALADQEQRYRYIFEAVSISIWEEDFSEVKAAIAQLKASGVKDFRQYFTDHPEFVQQTIAMVHLRDVNQATLRLFGAQSKAELLNSLHQIFTPEAEAVFVEELLAIADEKPAYAAETVLQTLQGDRFHVWFTIAFPPASEAYDRVLVSLVNISDRVYAEAALRESESRFRGVVESNMVGILFWNASGHIIAGNEMAVQMLGYSQEELQSGQVQWENITPAEFHEIDEAMQAQLLVEGVCSPFEKAYIRKDGTQVPILIGGALLPGYSDRGVAYFIDITDRKQSENALRQSEERYRYLTESIPQLVWTANAEGLLLDINQRWINYTGLSLEQAQIAGWQAVIHPDDVAVLNHYWVAAQQNDTHYQAEGRMRRADGVYRWHLHQAVPLKDAQGNILKWFGTATDIEEQKQLQQEREYLLQREQAARAEAEAANRVKDEFLAVLSHELRSPLNPILGWAKLLQDGKLDVVRTKHALATIERNAKLQAELIEDLLDVSRILRGKLNLTVSPVNLAATIQAAIETVRLAAEAKSIRIESAFASTGPIAGDATRLQQIMWNLLSNAVKFTPLGGQVNVKLEPVEHEREAQITITDTGKGIDPDFLPYIFDYFRQADSATTRQFGGLGLGLAIVRHLVELHGGTIQAESQGEGSGASFTVRLPLLKYEDGGRKDETDPLLPSSFRPHPLESLRVLLIDDDADTRDFVEFLLEQAGAKVTAVATAAEVLAILKRSPPDILLSDIGLPEMDGYMLMRQIRTLPPEQGGQVMAIALTAYAGDFNQQQAIAAGFQQHLSKPIDPETLVKAIATLTGTLPNRYHQDR
jgi:PAS domain S-box-containing protein